MVVTRSAPVAEAAKRICCAKFASAGQTCIAVDYLLVERAVLQQTVDAIVSRIKWNLGDAPDKAEYTHLVHASAAQRLVNVLREAHGGQIVLGGPDKLVEELPAYFPPTVVVDPSPDSTLMTEEIFGPIKE